MNKELNKLINLLRFTLLFRNDLYNQSPDYIIEKYDHFIGFQPTVEYRFYTPDNMATFFLKYNKRWKVNDTKTIMILRYLYTLSFSDNENIFQLMVKKFEEYIGELEHISSEPKRGLHTNLESVVSIITSNKLKELTPILRDLKLKSIGV